MSQPASPDTVDATPAETVPANGSLQIEGAAAPAAVSKFSAVQQDDFQEFAYRPVPVLVPITFVLGILSSLGLMLMVGLLFGLLGTGLGMAAIWKIRRSEGAFSGGILAWIGFVLSITFFSSGTVLHAYTIATEIPEGYRRVNFYHDISQKGFVVKKGSSDFFHPEVKALDNQKIFVKGFMYPTRQTEGLVSFLLVKDSGQCCFGGQPQATDMMLVNMKEGKAVKYKTGMISVAGTFHCEPVKGLTGLNENPVYVIDGDLMETSRTSF